MIFFVSNTVAVLASTQVLDHIFCFPIFSAFFFLFFLGSRRHLKDFMSAGLLSADVLQSRRKKLRFERSLVHAWGVFADEPIAAGDFVIEYR